MIPAGVMLLQLKKYVQYINLMLGTIQFIKNIKIKTLIL